MLIVRETFTARPGQGSKLAALLKDAASSMAPGHVRVMTDLIGPFNTVVLETEVGSLDEFELHLRAYASNHDLRERMRGYTDLWISGTREVFSVL